MPELPEVETVARQLAPSVTGRTVTSFSILDVKLRDGRVPRLAGRTFRGVVRSGKQVLFELSAPPGRGAPLWLAVHLRMTGRLIWEPGSRAVEREHLRARFVLDRGQLLFYDTRRFGTFRWYARAEAAAPAGLDPLTPAFTPRRLAELVGASRQVIKVWLLRQDRLVGLGNIYASEILHRARVSPLREARSLTSAEFRRVHDATRAILERAIDNCGTTFSDFQDAGGLEGGYGEFLAVYDRDGQPCRRCLTPIERRVQAQRSTFYCARCQPAGGLAAPWRRSARARACR